MNKTRLAESFQNRGPRCVAVRPEPVDGTFERLRTNGFSGISAALKRRWPAAGATARALAALGLSIALSVALFGPAMAQSSCSSDGEPMPHALLERFINADCDACWQDPATPTAKPGEIALDWVLQGRQGDDAPLSAVALRDAVQRLEALKAVSPSAALTHRSVAAFPFNQRAFANNSTVGNIRPADKTGPAPLRVARGIALNGYVGASIELRLPLEATGPRTRLRYPLTAWLLLTETIPAGSEGSPVSRALVRNSLVSTWNAPRRATQPTPADRANRHFESRPMSLPPGSNPEHINVIGWVEDAQGRLLASAVSVCQP